jgi:hypothetical protein
MAIKYMALQEQTEQMRLKQAELENQMLAAENQRKASIMSAPAVADIFQNATPDLFRFASNYISENDGKSNDEIINDLNKQMTAFSKADGDLEKYVKNSDAFQTGFLKDQDLSSVRDILKPYIDSGLYEEGRGRLTELGIAAPDIEAVFEPLDKNTAQIVNRAPEFSPKFNKNLKAVEKGLKSGNADVFAYYTAAKNDASNIVADIFEKAGDKVNPVVIRSHLTRRGYPDSVIIAGYNKVKDKMNYSPYHKGKAATYMNRKDVDIATENDMFTQMGQMFNQYIRAPMTRRSQ